VTPPRACDVHLLREADLVIAAGIATPQARELTTQATQKRMGVIHFDAGTT